MDFCVGPNFAFWGSAKRVFFFNTTCQWTSWKIYKNSNTSWCSTPSTSHTHRIVRIFRNTQKSIKKTTSESRALRSIEWSYYFVIVWRYGAGYYTYLYSSVFSSQLWNKCFKNDPLNREAGQKYVEKILQFGGVRDPKKMMFDMLGEGLDIDGFVQELKNNVFKIHNSNLSEWIVKILVVISKKLTSWDHNFKKKLPPIEWNNSFIWFEENRLKWHVIVKNRYDCSKFSPMKTSEIDSLTRKLKELHSIQTCNFSSFFNICVSLLICSSFDIFLAILGIFFRLTSSWVFQFSVCVSHFRQWASVEIVFKKIWVIFVNLFYWFWCWSILPFLVLMVSLQWQNKK